jgi:hypothetical protein
MISESCHIQPPNSSTLNDEHQKQLTNSSSAAEVGGVVHKRKHLSPKYTSHEY